MSDAPAQREPELLGQTVVVLGGSAGIGLETARRARVEGADVILTGRNSERLEQAASDLGAKSTAAFDATDSDAMQSFFEDLPTPIDHVMVTAGAPRYVPPLEMTPEEARDGLTEHALLASGWPATASTRSDRAAACCSWVAPVAGESPAATRS